MAPFKTVGTSTNNLSK